MGKVRVLVVDDSSVVRRLLTDILSSDDAMEVADTAGNGELALAKIESARPDVVTLDVEMPGMDGLATLEKIRQTHPKLPVIMFSALTERAAATTLEALAKGASDYVTKPSGTGSREASVEHVKSQLLPKIHALALRPTLLKTKAGPQRLIAPKAEGKGAVGILAVGASTGGPNALSQVFSALPRNLPVPVVVVQHMPPVFTRMLAERLTENGSIPFKEAVNGETLEAGKGYIAPGDFHMRVVKAGAQFKLETNQAPHVNSCRPSVDVLFQSVADVYGSKALALVLTGMGQDGLAGCRRLRECGAHIVVQDEATSVVWGMPGVVAKAQLSNAILPLEDIATELLTRVWGSSSRTQQAAP